MSHRLPAEAPPVPGSTTTGSATVLDASAGAIAAAIQWLLSLPPAPAPEPQPKRPRRRRRRKP